MKISIITDDQLNPDQVEIRLHPSNQEQMSLKKMIEAQYHPLIGYQDDQVIKLISQDIYYIEVIDDKVILYTKKETYTSKYRLYALEDQYPSFVRIHKSMIVNIDKIRSFKSCLNAKIEAQLDNGETIEINRTYVKALKERIGSL